MTVSNHSRLAKTVF
ncbi:hypothetical protein CP02DC14_2308A, partial [Chlamydia psittaci 02DC14]